MVVIEWPSAWTPSRVHDLTDSPSSSTVQAPQDDVSQPTTVPVRPSRSRSTYTSSSRGSSSSSWETSLTVSVTLLTNSLLVSRAARPPPPREHTPGRPCCLAPRLHLGSGQHEAGLHRVREVVVVSRAPVVHDRLLALRLGHAIQCRYGRSRGHLARAAPAERGRVPPRTPRHRVRRLRRGRRR